MAIDPNLQSNVSRPDNAYRYTERKVASESACHPSASMMTYGNEIKTLNAKVNEQADQIKKLTCDLNLIKQELEKTRQELKSTKHALSNITNELATAKKQQHHCNQQVQKWKQAYESMKSDCILMEDEFEECTDQISKLSPAFSSVEREPNNLVDVTTVTVDEKTMTFISQTTTDASKYSPAVRKLYYSLLANQTPSAKIEIIMKAVLKCFLPNLDVDRLPKEKCAGYMRREELKTISMAHKASILDVCIKAPPRVCMKNTAQGGVSRDKYSTRRSRVLYLSRDTPRVLYFSDRQA